jgi:hypothetical protein
MSRLETRATLTGIIKIDFYEGKGRLVKDFHNSFVQKIIGVGTSERSCSHFYLTCEIGC